MSHHSELCNLQAQLITIANEAVTNDISSVNTHELGEIVDMIKDISQAIYYDSVVESMSHDESWFDTDNVADNIRKIWDSADPDHKTILKSNLHQLLVEMDRG